MYAIVFIDAIHYSVKQDNAIVKKSVYVAIGIKLNGTKDVLGMWQYWLPTSISAGTPEDHIHDQFHRKLQSAAQEGYEI